MNNTQILKNTSLYADQYSLTNSSDISTKIFNYDVNISPSDNLKISFSRETFIPLHILKNNSSLEAIVYYLKEILNLTYADIASLLNRDQRTIWATCSNAKRKNISINVNVDESSEDAYVLYLPLNLFTSRVFSILETVVFYLKNDQNLSFNQISDLLGKNYRTIWTVYRRALKKLSNE
jgi:hypothetical protein